MPVLLMYLHFFSCVFGSASVIWAYLFIKYRKKSNIESNQKITNNEFSRIISLKLLLLGGLVYGTMSALNLTAVTRISASLASLLLCLYPAFVTIMVIILGREKMDRTKGVALAMTFSGLYLLLNVDFSSLDFIGILCGLGAACAYTLYVLLGDVLMQRLEPIRATAYILTGAGIVFTITGVLTKEISLNFGLYPWLMVIGLILFSTVLSIVLFWVGVSLIGPSKASIIGMVEPVSTVILAKIIFRETFTFIQGIGGLFILLGILVLRLLSKEKVTEEVVS